MSAVSQWHLRRSPKPLAAAPASSDIALEPATSRLVLVREYVQGLLRLLSFSSACELITVIRQLPNRALSAGGKGLTDTSPFF